MKQSLICGKDENIKRRLKQEAREYKYIIHPLPSVQHNFVHNAQAHILPYTALADQRVSLFL